MNRLIATLSKGFVIVSAAGALAAVSLVGTPANAQWVPPPPEYVATTEPVYYEGHAAYWYGNHWNWRDGHGAWNHYDHEPAALADRRMHAAPVRRSFEHGGRR
jgi:hypothetical protein